MNSQDLLQVLEGSWDLLGRSHDDEMIPNMRFVHERLKTPQSYISLVGETSSGKSTLINSFLGKRILFAGAQPTTGTVSWIAYGPFPKAKYYAINRDATVEEISYEDFIELTKNPDERLLRLKAEMPDENKSFSGMNIFDTPGFNSIYSEHSEVLKEFLPDSDVVVFSVNYKVGFGVEDQYAMGMVEEIGKKFGSVPVILVVNRVPADVDATDSRIAEIRSHAEDSLHSPVELVLVRSQPPGVDGGSVLPDTADLWRKVYPIAFSEERAKGIVEKCKVLIGAMLEQRIGEVRGSLAAIEASAHGAAAELDVVLRSLSENESKSYKIVQSYMSRLGRIIPRILAEGVSNLKKTIGDEIEDADKWSDCVSCRNYIYGHRIPFALRKISNEIEKYVDSEFQEMDRELSEVANTTVMKIETAVRMTADPELKDLMMNLAQQLGLRLGGDLAGNVVKGFGGVGGVAAGAGNLAKMAVKQIGALLGKRFGREVYTKIGKLFTKKLLQKAALVLEAVIELGDWIWECNVWQEKLQKECEHVLDQWLQEASDNVATTMIPEYSESNRSNVAAVYRALREDVMHQKEECQTTHSSDEIARLKEELHTLSKVYEPFAA